MNRCTPSFIPYYSPESLTVFLFQYNKHRKWIRDHKGAPNMPRDLMLSVIRQAWGLRKVLRKTPV